MINKTEVFFAILLGVVYGTKALLDKKEKPFISILISIVLIYVVAGTKIGFRPLNFLLFAAAVTFWYNVFFFIGKLGIRFLSAGYKLIVEAITQKFKSFFSQPVLFNIFLCLFDFYTTLHGSFQRHLLNKIVESFIVLFQSNQRSKLQEYFL